MNECIYTRNCIQNEWWNAVVIPLFKKGDRRYTNNYVGIGILNTCCKIHSKILYIKPQRYSKQFMADKIDSQRDVRAHC